MSEPAKSAPAPKKGSKNVATKSQKKDSKKGRRQEQEGELCHLSAQASPPQHQHLIQGHKHHELLSVHLRGGLATHGAPGQ
ncbi:unnamed protein product [Staurois parvus]|uniref:Uncharacterized protein n=1 Tax=Staurois parvus TaxID=386267 RepID=A0ABN9B7A7_9NEOB|nr:unnamed protein product [Staurois parvus]